MIIQIIIRILLNNNNNNKFNKLYNKVLFQNITTIIGIFFQLISENIYYKKNDQAITF